MTTRTADAPSKFRGRVEGLINGFTENPPESLTTLMVGGSSQTTTAVVAELQAIDARSTAVDKAKQAYVLALAAREAAIASDEAFVASVMASLKVVFEGNQGQLNAFGIAAPKPRTEPTPTQKVIAAEKGKATRVARGTMSKRQRQQITAGPTPTVTVNGVVATAASSSSGSSGSSPAAEPAIAAVSAPAAK